MPKHKHSWTYLRLNPPPWLRKGIDTGEIKVDKLVWPPQDKGIQKWRARITQDWEDTVASIIKTGLDLIQAKKELGHGRFGDLFVERPYNLLPFGQRTADRLMAIAKHPVLSDSTQVSSLPPSWATLYVLTRIPPDRLETLIRQDKVHAGMMRKDAERLLSSVANRIVSAIRALVGAMDDNDFKSTEALVAGMQNVLDDDDADDHAAWDAFRRLDEVAAFIVEMDTVWPRDDEFTDEGEVPATEAKASTAKNKLNGKGAQRGS